MNLKTWFKGLGVFVVSSFVTSLAAANLSPSTFNFSKQGLSKLATLAAIVGIKAVVLYLKQSPLPASGAAVNWTKVSGASVLVLALPLTGVVSGCVSSWEQDTYATLATGKALIDCAVAGYNHADADIRKACAASPGDAAFDATKFYIPQTRAAQQAIETARQAQVACVEAFEAYAVAKVANDKTVSLAQKQAAVAGYLAQLPELLNAVRELIGLGIGSSGDRVMGPSEDWGIGRWGHRIIGPSEDRIIWSPGGAAVAAAISRLKDMNALASPVIADPDFGWLDVPINRSPDLSKEVSRDQ